MKPDQAFLDAIVKAPEDDGPRLIYADWLDEHGDGERAEFIRLQIERASGKGTPTKRAARYKRECTLLHANEERWAGPLRTMVRRARFVRGFVEQVTLEGDQFLTHAKAMFRLAPIRAAVFTGLGDDLPRLADSTHLRRLDSLDFREGAKLDPAGVSVLTGSKQLGGLRHLALRFCDLGRRGAEHLAGCQALAGLKTLDLYAARLDQRGVAALARSEALAGLETLALGGLWGAAGTVAMLAGSRARLRNLTYLHLSFNDVDDGEAEQFAAAGHWQRLVTLDLKNNRIGDPGAITLARSENLPALTALDLRGNEIGARGKRALRTRFGDGVLL